MQKIFKLPKWNKILKDEIKKDYFVNLMKFVECERSSKIVYPSKQNVFAAFNYVDFDKIKVVVLGQDPYHGEGQAHGLSFSVKPGIKIPPSLKNIYKELNADVSFKIPNNGCLVSWAKQGVLLLNNCLTVEKAKAGSHQKKGWEEFTAKVIEELSENRDGLVFLLWGGPAQKKACKVQESKHYILKAPHPSPLSSYRGFFGCKHFSKTNAFLRSKGLEEIDWSIPNLDN